MNTLAEWLAWQETLHLSTIDLGLLRIRQVAERMDLLSLPFPVITVAGTNGKGSTCAMLTACLQAAGHTVGTYTSPHVVRYNERIMLNHQAANDTLICAAFAAINEARGDVSLTYFEFGTLAALYVFKQQAVSVAVLEVGLGGRLDATNLWDADIAIVTSIGIDHTEWLGHDRETIGAEKAGIAKAGRVLICGDNEPPLSISATVNQVQAILWQLGEHFSLCSTKDSFTLTFYLKGEVRYADLPYPALQGEVQLQNMACAVAALCQLQTLYPHLAVSQSSLQEGLQQVQLIGRLQCVQSKPDVWLDVAHNPQAAQILANWLGAQAKTGKICALFSIFADKDALSVVKNMHTQIDEWHVFTLPSERALPVEQIAAVIAAVDPNTCVYQYANAHIAWQELEKCLATTDRVVAFGSFLVVSEMLNIFTPHQCLARDTPRFNDGEG